MLIEWSKSIKFVLPKNRIIWLHHRAKTFSLTIKSVIQGFEESPTEYSVCIINGENND
jgi:hypothetical protein